VDKKSNLFTKSCTFKRGAWNCGSYQFNLQKNHIDQGDLCDVHYWQTQAQRPWVGLTDEEINLIYDRPHIYFTQYAKDIEAKLRDKNT
jgi:hypothetical protein